MSVEAVQVTVKPLCVTFDVVSPLGTLGGKMSVRLTVKFVLDGDLLFAASTATTVMLFVEPDPRPDKLNVVAPVVVPASVAPLYTS